MRNTSALFDTLPQARAAIQQLVAHGFQKEQINLLANATDEEIESTQAEAAGSVAAQIAEAGVITGGMGGFLVGFSFFVIPGVGPILAAGGMLLSLIAGSALGGLAGGAVALLVELGVPQEHAFEYAEAIRRGGTLVDVQCSEARLEDARAILSQQQPLDLDSRVKRWRESGWTNYDVTAAPYTRDQILLERLLNKPIAAY